MENPKWDSEKKTNRPGVGPESGEGFVSKGTETRILKICPYCQPGNSETTGPKNCSPFHWQVVISTETGICRATPEDEFLRIVFKASQESHDKPVLT